MTSQTVEGFHLSPQQKRLWAIHRGSELAYRAQCAVEVRGAVDTSVLRTAVEDVVRRHELLRTRLVLLPGMAFPLQSISDDVDFVGEADDCSAGTAPSPDSVWQEMATLHFDMSRGPALHYSIVTTAPDTHLFALCLPALHVDRTGLESLVVEIWRTYAALDAGSPSSGTPIQYADLSEWLNDLLSSDERAAGRGYWAKQESQCAAPLPLPLEHSADGPFNPASHACEIDSRLIAKIEAVAGQGEGALEAFLLAAWQCLIARLTSASRVTVGLGCDGRRHEELKNAIGLFTRYVPLSGEIGDDTPFAEILGQTAAASRDARLWQEYFDPARLRDADADGMGGDTGANRGLTPNDRGQTPAWGLTPALSGSDPGLNPGPNRGLTPNPRGQTPADRRQPPAWGQTPALSGSDPGLNPGRPASAPTTAAVCFEYHDRPAVFSDGELSFSFRKVSACVDRFRMLLSCSRAGGRVEASFVYDAHAFAQSAVHALAKQYLTLLESAASDPATAVARLSVLAEDERRRLIVGLNRTQRDYPGDKCLHQLFEAQAARTPDAVAVVHEDRRLTYSELNSRANRLARTLSKRGAGPEVLVGVCLERSPEMIVALLAIAKSGAAYVPLDPAYPQERLGLMVEDSGMPLLVTQTSLAPRFCAFGVRVLSVDADSATVAAEADHDLDSNVTPENLAYVIYTSGSTGKPKGVLIEHRSLVNYLDWSIEAYDVAGGAGAPVHSSISFDATITSVFPALLVGRPIVLVPEGEEIEGLGRLLRSDTGFSLIKITPAHLDLLSQMLGPEPVCGKPAFFVIGGEALFGKSVQYWKQHAPQSRLINEYGPTETVVGCCVYEIPADREMPASIPIGRPIANTRIYVLDRHLQPVPVGVAGEIYIGGAGVARGYLNRPALTDERFIADPFDPDGGRLYRTGDLARYLPDDNLEYLGRADEQIKLHGFRIEPGEVESAMTGYPGITEAVVLADADAAGTARLVAFFVAHDTPIDPNALRAFLEERLPKYMVPTLYVGVSALPLTPNGKVNRKALLQSDSLKGRSRAEYVAPKNAEEEMLARIWADVLKVEKVGAEDNFFDLGGDSIRSIQILARLKQAGFEVSLQQLFQYQTVAQMARVIPAARSGAAEALPAIEPYALLAAHDRAKLPEGVADAYPASALQLGMLFYSAYHPGDSLYVDIDTMHLRAPLDAGRLRVTLDVLARRHEALRTSFDTRAYSEPLQLVHGAACIPLEIEDIRGLPQAEQEARVHAWVAAQRTRGFAWDTAPLLRFHVFMRSDESFQLGFSRHHAILDGWSAAALLTEMVQQYLGLCGKDVAPLPEAPRARYRDFVAMERRVAASPEARRYWTTKLADVPVTALPRWKHAQPATADVPTRTRRLGRLDIELSAGLSEDLARAAQQTRTTLKSVLLAAHMKVMSALGSSDDIVTGLVSNGRVEEHDGERVLGLFLNTVPFRLELAGGTWSDLVRSVFEAECELLPFRRYPMAEIQRARGGQALFEVLFNFIHFHVYDGIARTPDVEILEATAYEQTNFTLLVSFSRAPSSQAVTLSLYYDAVELEDEQMRLLAEYYRDTLTSISREPDARYERHSVLTAPERRQLLVEWNDTHVDYPNDRCIHELFEAQVERTPDAPALQCGDSRLTYAELNAQANRVAHRLRALGVGAGSLAGICLDRSVDLVVGLLAVLKAGAAYVPLDPAYPRERVAFMLRDAGAALVLVHPQWRDLVQDSGAQVFDMEAERFALQDEPAGNLERIGSARDLAYVIYTSGSTGQPKGVAIEHRSAAVLLHWARDTFSPEERAGMLACTSICFDLSVFELFLPLSWGDRVILIGNALELPALADSQAVTFINTVPSAMTELVRLGAVPASVKVVGLAGEPLQSALVKSIYETTAVERVFNLYGPSEDTTYSTFVHLDRGSDEPVTIGRPIANTRLYVLDAHRNPVPVGVPGELYIGGDGLARGYLNRDELTAERFVNDPFGEDGARLYRTGDLVRYRRDGKLEFLGRLDHQVKIRGYRIELGEIEAALLQHPGLREAVVLARDSAEGGKRLIAYVVAAEAVPSASELRRFLQERLPGYMIPAAFLMLAAMPLNPNGKIDRRALPAAEGASVASAKLYEAPKTDTEKRIAALWQALLQVERVGVHDNFFDIGGHSLLLLQAYSKLGEIVPDAASLSLVDLFAYPTVRALAAHLDQQLGSAPHASANETQQRAAKQKEALQKSRQRRQRESRNV